MTTRTPRTRTAGRRAIRRPAAAVALVTALALTAGACGGDSGEAAGGEGDGKGTIEFWDNNGGVRTPVWKKIIAAFEKKYPDITVKYVPVPITDVQSKYDTAIAGGGLPDVGGVGTAYLANMVAQNALEPVGDRIESGALKGKLSPGMVESVRAAGGEGEEMFSVPTSANQSVLWYREDLFDQAGLDAPEDWDAFYEAAEELSDQGRNRFGFTIRGGAGSIAQALDMMYAQSGVDTFWKGDKTTVNAPENVEALERYAGLYKKATPAADLNNDFTKMVAQFDSGDIGMLLHNLGSYTDHVKAFGEEKIAGIPLPPSRKGAPRTVPSQPVDGLGLFRDSDNKAAAWKFIEFAASHEMNSLWNEEAGSIPSNTDAAGDAWIEEAAPVKAAVEAVNDPRAKTVQLPYYLPDWNSVSKADNEPAFQKLLLGEMTAQEFADRLAKDLNEAQAEWKEQRKE
ncbi:ABC transporter substrate-binding protein [Streptomyces zingiberis]|uniref:Sugar ABC transporter substrate-binding protein n=1 Tax=Streptomyces zingiberis TaxID=2053010 RepID=A0ABX1C3A5_9ACTN|nr:sugar ABC transporter substrate-binding protein [Streptomyces zingiberis]NJQ02124.1 sugar ABC transporter substrate-binding protein [Streptomyces zingiberis]